MIGTQVFTMKKPEKGKHGLVLQCGTLTTLAYVKHTDGEANVCWVKRRRKTAEKEIIVWRVCERRVVWEECCRVQEAETTNLVKP